MNQKLKWSKMKKIFFAYESGHQETIDSISKATLDFNKHQSSFEVIRWEDLSISGRILNKLILHEISECDIFACDLTYLNHNVMFELGYAIGKRKKILIFLNPTIEKSKEIYLSSKLLRNIGFCEYTSSRNILVELQSGSKSKTIFLDELNSHLNLDKQNKDLFYLSPSIETQAALDLQELLTKKKYNMLVNNSSEVEYQTLSWYIGAITNSYLVIIHLLGHDKKGSHNNNSEASFYAGLSASFNKEVLIIAPFPFKPPIDYEDLLIEYKSSDECAILTDDWIVDRIGRKVSEEKSTQNIRKFDNNETLLRLGIGDEVAEIEKEDLLNYFIESEAYRKAKTQSISIFVGRKGTGKSALFIKLEKDFQDTLEYYNIILKPESDELLDDLEVAEFFSSQRNKRSLLFAVWKFIFFNKLLVSICSKIEYKMNRGNYQINPQESIILELYSTHKHYTNLNFFGALREISLQENAISLVDDPILIEKLFDSYISKLISIIREYFKSNKYGKINILADNLDKTWDARNDLTFQAEMILSLIDYSNRIILELSDKTGNKLVGNTIILLRKDIFDYVLKHSIEPDKLIGRHFEIDWSRFPNQLQKLIEKRFEYKLGLSNSVDIESVWNDYFEFDSKSHPFKVILNYVVPRPRDVIYLLIKLFESAINKNKSKINSEDLEYALEAYSSFLHNNLIAELRAEFPEIVDVVGIISSRYANSYIEYSEFLGLLRECNITDKAFLFLESLFSKQYIVGKNLSRGNRIIHSYSELLVQLKERRFIFLKPSIHLLLNPISIVKFKTE
ncbi:P-loop ATPase, Sll1717 family [Leptospira levettii]|uniref:P-loop ATPase, Sll1717 family n=1 Tax=Leptospira levettii TaxID=2023178 RepID=UPI00223CAFD9|nr:hypothetical protein [Leptospira levettii]MCW7467782.1 nucleotide-binding protein [Leptospira levettii]MCW7472600.1 nucleotide-binding protein [Leptospira levettii]